MSFFSPLASHNSAKFSTLMLYFILAVVLIGGSGISIPIGIEYLRKEDHTLFNINQNIITYYIAILTSASIDICLTLISKKQYWTKFHFLFIVLVNIFVFVFSIWLIKENFDKKEQTVIWLTSIGVGVSFVFWFISKFNDPVVNPEGTLGDLKKELSNGR